jgi:pimeloyl-ACP methyl ester carboxylesterase
MEVCGMRVRVNGVSLWFDVSGPALALDDDGVRPLPTLVAVHGGPGVDHISSRLNMESLTGYAQVIFYDQRGHGRSDYSSAEHWNLRTWASDLRGFCDAVEIGRPVVLGSSFGGFVALTYAALFPDHPGGVILTNTTGGRTDYARSVELFRRLGGDQAADVAARDFAEKTEESAAAFDRVCYPLYSARPGYVEEAAWRTRLGIRTREVNLHYWRYEEPHFDPWDLLPSVSCPVQIIAGEDDPICPVELVQDLANRLPGSELVRLTGSRHTVFRDQPEAARDAVIRFIHKHAATDQPNAPDDA